MLLGKLPAILGVCLTTTLAAAQAPPPSHQNPSPMTEIVRRHERVEKTEVKGKRWTLSTGTLLLPDSARLRATMPLYIHFHGAPWLAEWSVNQRDPHAAVITVQLGAGSGVYSQAFKESVKLASLLEEAAHDLSPDRSIQFRPVVLSGWSAGYGAIREILRNHDNWKRIDAVLLEDGIHTSYVPDGQPGPLDPAPLEPFIEFAREAIAGRKTFVILHSEIFPGTFASTTECSEYVLHQLGLAPRPVLKWGPLGMQQISAAGAGKFRVMGFAGNTAPDHVDFIHSTKTWLRMLK
ncbi:MAG: hypothetical protein ACRD3E_18450 [Terriglobales bacterium]